MRPHSTCHALTAAHAPPSAPRCSPLFTKRKVLSSETLHPLGIRRCIRVEASQLSRHHPHYPGSSSGKPENASSRVEEVIPLTSLHDAETNKPTWPSSAARQALYSDVPVERVDGMKVTVRGRVPRWLRGSFYRNGPGQFKGAHAVLDGCAMITRFAIDGEANSVVVSHRFLETTYLQAVRAAGGGIRWKMAHDPSSGRGALGRLAYVASLGAGALAHGVHLGDNALISIFPDAAGELVAHTETLSGTYRIHPETLETLGRVSYVDKPSEEGVTGMIKTAHPHTLPSGDVINLACDFMPVATPTGLRKPHITVYRHPAEAPTLRQRLASVPYLKPSSPTWLHQPAVSRSNVVIVQNPCFYDIEKMVFGENGDHMVFSWEPEEGSLIHVVPLCEQRKKNGTAPSMTKAFRAPAFLGTHWINAYESPDKRYLYCDACVANDPGIMAHWALPTVRSGQQGGKQIETSGIQRLTIDLAAEDGSWVEEPRPLIHDQEALGYSFELPAINPKFSGRRHRFVYGACARRPTNCWNSLAKVDVETGKVLATWYQEGGACWEPVFVPRPSGIDEDDGVVLCTVMQADGKTALIILDGRKFMELGRAVMPYGLPNGFHGCFIKS